MNKDIKDYLHLYFGCEVMYKDERFVLLGYNKQLEECTIERDESYSIVTAIKQVDEVKPILRPLSDMTEEEAIELAKLIYPYNVDDYTVQYQPYDEKMYEDAKEMVRVNFEGAVFGNKIERLMLEVYNDFSTYHFYCRPDGAHSLPIRNQHQITGYLLKQHFDLFGLIEAGLAIDKTKVNKY